MESIACVYEIRNTVNNHLYIGSTRNFYQRRRKHLSDLNLGIHRSKHLQNAYKKYGKDIFEIKPLIICMRDELLRYEQSLMDALHPEYNNLLTAGHCRGWKHSEITKRKISASKMGHETSVEVKEKLRQWATNRIFTDEHRKKLSIARKGYRLTDESKQKLREKALGRKWSVEERQKLSEAHKGHRLSEESKKKLSEAIKGTKRPYLYGKPAWNRGIPCSDETKRKISETKLKNKRKV